MKSLFIVFALAAIPVFANANSNDPNCSVRSAGDKNQSHAEVVARASGVLSLGQPTKAKGNSAGDAENKKPGGG